jgi:hypothetical protein
MVFNRKASFFLDLGSEGAKPAQVAVAVEAPKAAPSAAPVPAVTGKTAAGAAAPDSSAAAAAPSLTTAEAIAAELRAAQEARPPASTATFAPEALNPANAVPSRRRRAGANLAGFKSMASGLLGTAKG